MNALGEVALLAQHLLEADRRVVEAEVALSVAKENARRLREEALPGAMDELGLTKVELSDGSSITTAQEVYCSITEAMRAEAHAWLDENGFSGLIKTNVVVPFSRDEPERLGELVAWLQLEGVAFAAQASVHPQTLKAWLKEQLREGAAVPLQLFGARPVTVAKVKLAKGK